MTEIWFMRHGETDWNVVRRLQGWRDIALNETGRTQAEYLGTRLAQAAEHTPFDAAYSSDLQRTMQTLAPAMTHLNMRATLEPGLRERHYGALEGLAIGELADKAPPEAYASWVNREVDGSVGDGETLRQFHDRVIGTVQAIAARHPDQRVLVMTHGGVLDIILRHAQGTPLGDKQRRTPMFNVSINRVAIGEQGWDIQGWGDVSHMPAPVGNDIVA